jgi:hypothetical protein
MVIIAVVFLLPTLFLPVVWEPELVWDAAS